MYTAEHLAKLGIRISSRNTTARKIGAAYHLSDGRVIVLPGHGVKKWVTL